MTKRYLHRKRALVWLLGQSTRDRLANVPRTVTGKSPVAVISTRRLANSRPINPERDPEITGVGELCASSNTHLATAANSSATDGDVVAVLNQDSVIAVVGEINCGDDSRTRLADAEDTASAAPRLDPVNVDVGVVVAVCVASITVGEAEGTIAGTSANVVAVDKSDVDVDGVLEQQTRLADVAGNDLVDLQAIDVPGLDSVAVAMY